MNRRTDTVPYLYGCVVRHVEYFADDGENIETVRYKVCTGAASLYEMQNIHFKYADNIAVVLLQN